jgi:hypothetical protein
MGLSIENARRQKRGLTAALPFVLAMALAATNSRGFPLDEKSFYQRFNQSTERIRVAERSGKDVDSVAGQLVDVFSEYSRSKNLNAANAEMEAVESVLSEIFTDKELA